MNNAGVASQLALSIHRDPGDAVSWHGATQE
jgi:hypothetical protein